jgi:hypothetical protein
MATGEPTLETNPDDPGQPPIGFRPPGLQVDVRAVDPKLWSLLQSFQYQAIREKYDVPAGELTDFASVPRVFVWFVPKYGLYTRAAILHDYLCRLAEKQQFRRREADGLFRQSMRIVGVAFLRRWLMWVAVRWGGLFARGVRSEFIKDAWLVVPLSLAVSPLLLPPVVVIFAALLIWYALEMLAWVALRLGRAARPRHAPTKKLVSPELSLRL